MSRIVWVLLLLSLSATSGADVAKLAGSVEAEIDGQRHVFSALSLHYEVDVRGDVANVKLTQTFENPLTRPVQARYLFPLNSNAAVHGMTMQVGDELIEAVIQRKREAQKTFAKAQAAGKAASLLTQQRPNMFTQKIANLMPGLPIEVTIAYSQRVQKVDGAFELVIPMVVGPRFQPADAAPSEVLPSYPLTAGVHLPKKMVSERVSLAVHLEGGLPLELVHSATHELAVKHVSSTQAEISFAQQRELDNRDFVLRYTFAAEQASAGLLTHWQVNEGGYFNLIIEPPAKVQSHQILPREMVFLLDCSGSMSGLPMDASKRFMSEALRTLRPEDTFRIIRFSDTATEFSVQPVVASPANIARGLRYVANLFGSGGTVMTSGIKQALGGPQDPRRVKNVVFLTDGYIGNESSVLGLIETLRGEARLFAFGVGTGVNRYLLGELGRVGRGFTRYFDPTKDDETLAGVAAELVRKLKTPVLKDLEIDWGGLAVSDVLPRELPDLYAGNTISVSGRFEQAGRETIVITGRNAESISELRQDIALSDAAARPVVRRIWARAHVADLNQQFLLPEARRQSGADNATLQELITAAGLNFDLVTRWTAFVAVSRRIYNDTDTPAAALDVALPRVKGVSAKAYNTGTFGYAAPEPGIWLSFLLGGCLLAGLELRKRRQKRARLAISA